MEVEGYIHHGTADNKRLGQIRGIDEVVLQTGDAPTGMAQRHRRGNTRLLCLKDGLHS